MLLLLLTACSDHTVTVNRQPPAVSLIAPAQGARYAYGEPVIFEAIVRDEDALDALIYRWSSDLQGAITGEQELLPDPSIIRFTAALSDGLHLVSLDVTDRDGQRGGDQLSVEVLADTDADGDGFDDRAAGGQDCDDTDPSVHPDADELCDGVDNDCDGAVDDGAADAPAWYADADADGYGDPAVSTRSCAQPAGTVGNDLDCADADPAVSPDAAEICNDIDDDCDTQVDEPDAVDALIFYADADADAFGDPEIATLSCDQPAGYSANSQDCDDADGAVNPDAAEVCGDGVDNDCDGGAAGCRLSGSVAHDAADILLYGEANNDAVGWVLVGPGDLTRDGCADLAAGGPDAGDDAQGVLYLVAGCGGTGEGFLADAEAVILGGARHDSFGASAAGGDLDGDGLPELIAGAPGADGLADDQGGAWVFTGPLAGAVGAADASQIITAADEVEGAGLGAAVTAGDLDGDGLDDLLVTAPGAAPYGTRTGGGSAFVFLGAAGDLDAADADYTIHGGAEGDGLGEAATLAADFDGDGLADLAVTAPEDDTAGSGAGALFVFLADHLSGTHSSSQAQGIYTGIDRHDTVGRSIAAGDLDGDGADELVLGAPDVDEPDTDGGVAYVIAGGLTGSYGLDDGDAVVATIGGLAANEYVGQSLSVGDLDGDGAADLLVGGYGAAADTTHTYAGWAGLFYGLPAGALSLEDADLLIAGGEDYARVGAGAAMAGDLGGDGAGDIVLGAPAMDGGGSNAGAVLIYFGGGL